MAKIFPTAQICLLVQNWAQMVMGVNSGFFSSPGMAKQNDGPLTVDEQFVLRSQLWELTRVSRIARPAALYDAPIEDRTFGDVGRVLGNPIDSDGAAGANLTKSDGCLKFTNV